MKRLKLRSERGETLVEVLASVLIVTLSVMMLVGSVMASSKMDIDARRLDETHYVGLSNAETHGTKVDEVKIVIKNEDNKCDATLEFNVYGDGDAGMYSYVRKES